MNSINRYSKLITGMKNWYTSNRNKNKILIIILLIFTISGLISKFHIALNSELDSDMAYHGFISLELWKRGISFLLNYSFYNPDPDFFTGFIINIPIQIVCNFDPNILKFTAFVVFFLVLFFASLFFFLLFRKLNSTLLFSALLATCPGPVATDYLMPKSHIVTLFFIFVLFFFLFQIVNLKSLNEYIALLIIGLLIFSDSIVMIWIVIPLLILNLDNRVKKLFSPFFFKRLFIISIGVLIIKQIIPHWSVYGIKGIGYSQINWIEHLVIVIKSLKELIIPTDHGLILIFYIFSISCILCFFLLNARTVLNTDSVSNITKKPITSITFFFGFTVISTLFTILAVLFLASGPGIRYLLIIQIFIFMWVSFLHMNQIKYKKVLTSILIMLLCINMMYSITNNLDISNEPNYQEIKILNELKANNISTAFGDYWDSHLLTYLSKGNIIVRPLNYQNGEIKPWIYLSLKQWYSETPIKTEPLIIIRKDNQLNNGNIPKLVCDYPPDSIKYFYPYSIYIYNRTNDLPINENFDLPNAIYRKLQNFRDTNFIISND